MCFNPPAYGINCGDDIPTRQIIEIEAEEQKRSETDPDS